MILNTDKVVSYWNINRILAFSRTKTTYMASLAAAARNGNLQVHARRPFSANRTKQR
jgi:hypothetical protein